MAEESIAGEARAEQLENKNEEEQKEIPPIAEFPIPFEELKNLSVRVEAPEKREQLERFTENLRQACFRYDESLGRTSDYRTRLVKGEVTEEERGIYNELQLSVMERQEVLTDALNILSRNMKNAGLDISWRESFITNHSIGDWAIRVVTNRKRETHKTLDKEGESA